MPGSSHQLLLDWLEIKRGSGNNKQEVSVSLDSATEINSCRVNGGGRHLDFEIRDTKSTWRNGQMVYLVPFNDSVSVSIGHF